MRPITPQLCACIVVKLRRNSNHHECTDKPPEAVRTSPITKSIRHQAYFLITWFVMGRRRKLAQCLQNSEVAKEFPDRKGKDSPRAALIPATVTFIRRSTAIWSPLTGSPDSMWKSNGVMVSSPKWKWNVWVVSHQWYGVDRPNSRKNPQIPLPPPKLARNQGLPSRCSSIKP